MIADVWRDKLLRGRFGDVPLDILVTRDELSRSLPALEPLGRDGALHQDQGLAARPSRCRLIFYERPGDPADPIDALDHIERFKRFDLEVRRGARDFVHPVFGTFRAYAKTYGVEADANHPNALTVDVEFVEDGLDPRSISGVGEPIAGAATVAAAAAALDASVLGLSFFSLTAAPDGSTVSSASVAKVTAWETDPDVTSEQVNGDLSDLSKRMSTESDALESQGTDAMPAIRALNVLHSAVRLAAQARRRDQPITVDYLVPASMPLRALVSRLYANEVGADQASMVEAIMRLNRISDPLDVPAGTVLRRPSSNRLGIGTLSGGR